MKPTQLRRIKLDLSKLSAPLSIKDVEWRVQQVSVKGYAQLLVYKNARVDMQRLDDVAGPQNWQRIHTRDNANCIVSIWNADIGQWVHKEDTGTQSNTEAEKGQASDSFKRACTNWGIGRNLYSFPKNIWIRLNPNEFKISDTKKDKYGKFKAETTFDFKLPEWKWYAEYDDHGTPTYLAAQDNNGATRFTWGIRKPKQQ